MITLYINLRDDIHIPVFGKMTKYAAAQIDYSSQIISTYMYVCMYVCKLRDTLHRYNIHEIFMYVHMYDTYVYVCMNRNSKGHFYRYEGIP